MTGHALLALISIALLLPTAQSASSGVGPRGAVVEALEANHRLTVRVLWLDRVPADSGSTTAGPALAQLRQSAAGRLRAGIRVRLLSDQFQVSGVKVAGAFASAILVDRERVRPCSLAGRPLGAPVSLHEAALAILHRQPGTNRFVVWELRPR